MSPHRASERRYGLEFRYQRMTLELISHSEPAVNCPLHLTGRIILYHRRIGDRWISFSLVRLRIEVALPFMAGEIDSPVSIYREVCGEGGSKIEQGQNAGDRIQLKQFLRTISGIIVALPA